MWGRCRQIGRDHSLGESVHWDVLVPSQDKQLTKASFLAELRGKSAAAAQQQRQQPGAPAAGAAGTAPSEQAAAADKPAWEALQDDFSSLQSGLRMKVCTTGRVADNHRSVHGARAFTWQVPALVATLLVRDAHHDSAQDWDKREAGAQEVVAEDTMADLGSDSGDE